MSANTAATLTDASKPTVVLVHGAFADSSSWNGVIAQLRGDGYPVIGVANPLRALHSDAEFLGSVLASVDGPIVLAGHSYGGSVMSEAADGNPKVKALVYVASFVLEEGESTGELAGKFPGNELGPVLRPVPVGGPDGQTVHDLYIEQEKFREVFAADVPEEVAALLAVTRRPSSPTRSRGGRQRRPGGPSPPGTSSRSGTSPSRPSPSGSWPSVRGRTPSRSTPPTR
jgi:pimeloyl-ACP methyl ester carboxylesterase